MTSSSTLTIADRLDSITGRDEVAIEDHFGHDIWDTWDAIDDKNPSKKVNGRFAKMLVFVQKLHDGLPGELAYNTVLDMTAAEVNDFLNLNEDDEDDEGQAAAKDAAGKDEPGES